MEVTGLASDIDGQDSASGYRQLPNRIFRNRCPSIRILGIDMDHPIAKDLVATYTRIRFIVVGHELHTEQLSRTADGPALETSCFTVMFIDNAETFSGTSEPMNVYVLLSECTSPVGELCARWRVEDITDIITIVPKALNDLLSLPVTAEDAALRRSQMDDLVKTIVHQMKQKWLIPRIRKELSRLEGELSALPRVITLVNLGRLYRASEHYEYAQNGFVQAIEEVIQNPGGGMADTDFIYFSESLLELCSTIVNHNEHSNASSVVGAAKTFEKFLGKAVRVKSLLSSQDMVRTDILRAQFGFLLLTSVPLHLFSLSCHPGLYLIDIDPQLANKVFGDMNSKRYIENIRHGDEVASASSDVHLSAHMSRGLSDALSPSVSSKNASVTVEIEMQPDRKIIVGWEIDIRLVVTTYPVLDQLTLKCRCLQQSFRYARTLAAKYQQTVIIPFTAEVTKDQLFVSVNAGNCVLASLNHDIRCSPPFNIFNRKPCSFSVHALQDIEISSIVDPVVDSDMNSVYATMLPCLLMTGQKARFMVGVHPVTMHWRHFAGRDILFTYLVDCSPETADVPDNFELHIPEQCILMKPVEGHVNVTNASVHEILFFRLVIEQPQPNDDFSWIGPFNFCGAVEPAGGTFRIDFKLLPLRCGYLRIPLISIFTSLDHSIHQSVFLKSQRPLKLVKQDWQSKNYIFSAISELAISDTNNRCCDALLSIE